MWYSLFNGNDFLDIVWLWHRYITVLNFFDDLFNSVWLWNWHITVLDLFYWSVNSFGDDLFDGVWLFFCRRVKKSKNIVKNKNATEWITICYFFSLKLTVNLNQILVNTYLRNWDITVLDLFNWTVNGFCNHFLDGVWLFIAHE